MACGLLGFDCRKPCHPCHHDDKVFDGKRVCNIDSERASEWSPSEGVEPIQKYDIPLVSLGCACGPKLAFAELGREAPTLPFDWITTTSDGVLDFLRTDFQNFFAFERKVQANAAGVNVTAYRSKHHAFWHDDPTLQDTHEKYNRRFQRLWAITAINIPVLFVRLAATSEEIRTVGELMLQLISQFGPLAHLLLIIDCQGTDAFGPCIVTEFPNLLIHYLPGSNGVGKFCDPIDNALDWAADRPVDCKLVHDLTVAMELAKPVTPGYWGMGGIAAFEGIPDLV